MYDYDACLIYTPYDHAVAEPLLQSLVETAHLRVTHHRFDITLFDRDKIIPLLDRSATCVILISERFISPWDYAALRKMLEARAHVHSLRLIFLIAPGVEHPPIPANSTDLMNNHPQLLSALTAAIVGSASAAIPNPDLTDNPQLDLSISGVFSPVSEFSERPELDQIRMFWRGEQNGVLALIGMGGSGKTALLTRFLQEIPNHPLTVPGLVDNAALPPAQGLFVWSIYDNPNIEYFIRGLYTYLTREETTDAARDVVYRLIRRMEDHSQRLLIVLDGLELVQENPESAGEFGLLRDSSLRHFVRRIAQGDLPIKLMITSRYPLPELKPFEGTSYQVIDTNLLHREAARQLLRSRGVEGQDDALNTLIDDFGTHALTLDHLGRILRDYFNDDPQGAASLPSAPSHMADTQDGRLARVLAFYPTHLTADEMAVLQVVSLLRNSVSVALLKDIFGRTTGTLPSLDETTLRTILVGLSTRGLITFYGLQASEVCIVHPAMRTYFSSTIEQGREDLQSLVSINLQLQAMISRQDSPPNPAALEIYEQALYHLSQARQDVSRVYEMLGGYLYLSWLAGDYQRGLRIATLLVERLGVNFMNAQTSVAYHQALYLLDLGELNQAEQLFLRALSFSEPLVGGVQDSLTFTLYEVPAMQSLCDTMTLQGKLVEAHTMINVALVKANDWLVSDHVANRRSGSNPYARRAVVRSLLGDVKDALEDFQAADIFVQRHAMPFETPMTSWHHKLYHVALLSRLGHLDAAQARLDQFDYAHTQRYRPLTAALYDLTAAELAYARGQYDKATQHIEVAYGWAMQSGQQHIYAQALVLWARVLLRTGQPDKAQSLLDEALQLARERNFNLQRIDALIVSGHIALQRRDFALGERVAQEAFASATDLTYRWGIGDATYLLAKCAFEQMRYNEAMMYAAQSLTIRQIIQDPKIQHTQALIQDIELSQPKGSI